MLPTTDGEGCFHIIGLIVGDLHGKNPLGTGTMWVTGLHPDGPCISCLIVQCRRSGKGAIFIEQKEIIIRIPLPAYQGVYNDIPIRIGGIKFAHQGSRWLVFCHINRSVEFRSVGAALGKSLCIEAGWYPRYFRTSENPSPSLSGWSCRVPASHSCWLVNPSPSGSNRGSSTWMVKFLSKYSPPLSAPV